MRRLGIAPPHMGNAACSIHTVTGILTDASTAPHAVEIRQWARSFLLHRDSDGGVSPYGGFLVANRTIASHAFT